MGCSNSTKPSEVQKVKISESLLVQCQDALLLESDSMEEIIDKLLVNSQRLNQCKAKHSALIEQVRKSEK